MLKRVLIGLVFVVVMGWSQTPPYNLQIAQQPLPIVSGVTANYVGGTPGTITNYYWVVARYGVGNANPSVPIQVNNITIGSGSVTIQWNSPANPSGYALTYDVLRSRNPTLPNGGTCNCLVVGATTSHSASDTLVALTSYTLNSYNPFGPISLTLDNIDSTSAILLGLFNGANILPSSVGIIPSQPNITLNGPIGPVVNGTISSMSLALAAGENDILCNPTGSTNRIIVDFQEYGSGASTMNFFWQLKLSSGTYIALSASLASTNNGNTNSLPVTQGLEAGECISADVTTIGSGGSVMGSFFNYANTSTLHSVRLVGSADTSTHILYTAPSKNGAWLFTNSWFGGTLVNGVTVLIADSGADTTFTMYLVPPNGSAGASTLVYTHKVTTGANAGVNFPQFIPPSWSLQVKNDVGASTSLMAEVEVYEP